jgi:hypothetical protein
MRNKSTWIGVVGTLSLSAFACGGYDPELTGAGGEAVCSVEGDEYAESGGSPNGVQRGDQTARRLVCEGRLDAGERLQRRNLEESKSVVNVPFTATPNLNPGAPLSPSSPGQNVGPAGNQRRNLEESKSVVNVPLTTESNLNPGAPFSPSSPGQNVGPAGTQRRNLEE